MAVGYSHGWVERADRRCARSGRASFRLSRRGGGSEVPAGRRGQGVGGQLSATADTEQSAKSPPASRPRPSAAGPDRQRHRPAARGRGLRRQTGHLRACGQDGPLQGPGCRRRAAVCPLMATCAASMATGPRNRRGRRRRRGGREGAADRSCSGGGSGPRGQTGFSAARSAIGGSSPSLRHPSE